MRDSRQHAAEVKNLRGCLKSTVLCHAEPSVIRRISRRVASKYTCKTQILPCKKSSDLLKCLESGEIDTGKLMGLEKTLVVAYWLRSLQEDTGFDGVDLLMEKAVVRAF